MMSLREQAAAVASGSATPADLVDQSLSAIGDDPFNAFITVMADSARAAALSDLPEGPLRGVPIAVKDNMATRDAVTTSGSPIFAEHRPSVDARVVQRIRDAGAIVIGKTNLDELTWGGTTDNATYGRTSNPWNPDRFAAGSSGGSAVAVAAGYCAAALGSDTGGSIRLPAAMNGIVGLRPTWGRISVEGVTPLAWSMDSVGPMASSVDDCALLYSVLVDDHEQPTRQRPNRNIRLGVTSFFFEGLDADVARVYRRSLDALDDAEFQLWNVDLPDLARYMPPWLVAHMVEPAVQHRDLLLKHPLEIAPHVRDLLALGLVISGAELDSAQRFRAQFTASLACALSDVDVLVCPTVPFPAVPHGSMTVTLEGQEVPLFEALPRFTGIASFTGLPALSLPAGASSDGLPIGLQLIGRAGGEADLLSVASSVEDVLDWRTPQGVI